MKIEVVKWFSAGAIVVILNLLLGVVGLGNLLQLNWLISSISNLIIGIIGLTVFGWLLLFGLESIRKMGV